MPRGRVGGKIGARDTGQPSTCRADGAWGLQEAFDALWRSSWPRSLPAGFFVRSPSPQNGTCNRQASFSSLSGRSSGSSGCVGWGDPVYMEWQKSESNSNTPITGNPWLSDHSQYSNYNFYQYSYTSDWNQDPPAVYATGSAPSPLVTLSRTAATSSADPFFSQVTLLASFNDGCFDMSSTQRSFFMRRGGSLATSRKRNGTRSFTSGAISYYGPQTISGDFTFEGWFWFDETTASRPLFSIGTISESGGYAQLSLNQSYIEYQRFGLPAVVLTNTVIDSQEWVHIALVRTSSTVKLFVNGIETGSTTHSGVIGDSLLSGNLQVYAKAGDHIDEVRLTSAARYSTSFSPPSSAFPGGGATPQIVVSGAGSIIANGVYHPKATGNSSWDAKQFYANASNGTCVFWDSPRGFWVIALGTQSGPSGYDYEGYGGGWLYASDGSCWRPISYTEKVYQPTTQTLSLSGLTFLDNDTYYRAKVKSGFNEASSKPARLTVEPLVISFPTQPSDQFAVNGQASFSASAVGSGQSTGDSYTSFAYQWQKRPPGSTGAFNNIIGQTGSSLTVSGVSLGDNGEQYRLRVSCGELNIAYSRTALLYVGSPSLPLNLYGVPGDSQVTLSWTQPASEGDFALTDYVVQYSSDGGANWITFQDGVGAGTSTVVTGLTNGTGYIFRVAAVNSYPLQGPFCQPTPRIVPSPAGTDPYFDYVSFVSNFEGGNNSELFEDQSLAARTVEKFGQAKISTSVSKWGSAAYFDGSGDYLSIQDPSAFKIGNQDFTVEAWVYPTTNSGPLRAFVTTADPTDQTGLWIGQSPNEWYWLVGNSGWAASGNPYPVQANEWSHIALCRSGGVLRFYVNGVVRQSVANATNISNSNGLLRIGGRTVGGQWFEGYIGGLRFTKGVDRYPLGVTFAVPSSPFPVSVVGATPPDSPTGVYALAGTRQASLNWTAPAANGSGIKDYIVQYSGDGGTTWTNFSDGTSKSTLAVVTGLSDATEYVFRVAAVNYIGTGSYSDASVAVTTNSLPSQPTSVSGTPGNGEASLTWSEPASTGGAAITDYAIQYSSNGGTSWSTFSDSVSPSTSGVVTGLTNGTPYLFRVAAVTEVGAGPYSDPSSQVSPTGTVPNAPTSLSGSAGDQQVSLSWASPANDGGSAITSYTIEYAPSGGSPQTIATGNSTASYVVTGLTNGTAYTFRVAATNSNGTGAYSNATPAITPLAFTPMAVILTSGTSYAVPAGATSMKAWAVSSGTDSRAGGVAYKTWAASGGTTISYSLGGFNPDDYSVTGCELTYDGSTISSSTQSPFFSGGDGGAAGGVTSYDGGAYIYTGGAIGGNSAAVVSPCGRRPATDVSGLLAAVALAGGKSVEDCGTTAAFGSGGYIDKYNAIYYQPGIGGATGSYWQTPGAAAIVLYFT